MFLSCSWAVTFTTLPKPICRARPSTTATAWGEAFPGTKMYEAPIKMLGSLAAKPLCSLPAMGWPATNW